MMKDSHVASESIDRAVADSVTILRRSNKPGPFLRLAEPLQSAFTRWFLDEINQATSMEEAASVVAAMASYMLAEIALTQPDPAAALLRLQLMTARLASLRLTATDAGLMSAVEVPVQQGGHA